MKHGIPVPQLLLLLTVALMISGGARAQFPGPPGFTAGPSSAMGTGTNAMVLASTASGFTATGTYTVNITGPANDVLAAWNIDRPIPSGVSNPSSNWVIDVPVESSLVAVPEPTSAWLLAAGPVVLLARPRPAAVEGAAA